MKNEKDILNWFNRNASDDELLRLKKTEDFNTLEKIAHYGSQIDTPKVDVEKALEGFKLKNANNTKKGKVVNFNFKQAYKYAAAIILLFTSSYFLFFNTESTSYKTEYAETTTFNLPDASEVVLNANSEVTFSEKEWQKSRDLSLKGEAYFKVEKGQTFSVNTEVGRVQVVGTQFNVKQRTNFFEVKCYEGIVKVKYNTNEVTLTKGHVFKVIDGEINAERTFNINDKSWLQKESTFKSIPLRIVLEDLQNQYNYRVKTVGVDVEQLFTGSFTHNDIKIALQSITIPLQLAFEIKEKTIVIIKK